MASGFEQSKKNPKASVIAGVTLKALCWKHSSCRVKINSCIEAGVKVCYAHGFRTNCLMCSLSPLHCYWILRRWNTTWSSNCSCLSPEDLTGHSCLHRMGFWLRQCHQHQGFCWGRNTFPVLPRKPKRKGDRDSYEKFLYVSYYKEPIRVVFFSFFFFLSSLLNYDLSLKPTPSWSSKWCITFYMASTEILRVVWTDSTYLEQCSHSHWLKPDWLLFAFC